MDQNLYLSQTSGKGWVVFKITIENGGHDLILLARLDQHRGGILTLNKQSVADKTHYRFPPKVNLITNASPPHGFEPPLKVLSQALAVTGKSGDAVFPTK